VKSISLADPAHHSHQCQENIILMSPSRLLRAQLLGEHTDAVLLQHKAVAHQRFRLLPQRGVDGAGLALLPQDAQCVEPAQYMFFL